MDNWGKNIRVTSFGESHGKAIGVVLEGVPAGTPIDLKDIQADLDRRRPGQSALTTSRDEQDRVHILSGIFEGKALGSPIALVIKNKDAKPEDYEHLKSIFRPSHADFTYQSKYGIRDYRGGGRSSARVTAGWVAAGSIARQMLRKKEGIEIKAFVNQVADVRFLNPDALAKNLNLIEGLFRDKEENDVRCPDAGVAKLMTERIQEAKQEGDSLGGVVTCVIKNVPVGLGEPLFAKLHAELARAMFHINAVKGFEMGGGFEMVKSKGSEVNDSIYQEGDLVKTKTNYSGGIQAGISNGMPIYFNVAFKPTSTIKKAQTTIDNEGSRVDLQASGRHDPCVVPRAVPIVESMAALVLSDAYEALNNGQSID